MAALRNVLIYAPIYFVASKLSAAYMKDSFKAPWFKKWHLFIIEFVIYALGILLFFSILNQSVDD